MPQEQRSDQPRIRARGRAEDKPRSEGPGPRGKPRDRLETPMAPPEGKEGTGGRRSEEEKKRHKQAVRIAENFGFAHNAGAPFSVEFIELALEQGLSPQQVKAILGSGALGGATTSGSFSSAEVLDFFTANPELIPQLYDVVEGVEGAPINYGEWLAAGSPGGTFYTPNQLIQQQLMEIPGYYAAYLSGAGPDIVRNAGGFTIDAQRGVGMVDPETGLWHAPAWWYRKAEVGQPAQTPTPSAPANPEAGPSFIGGFDFAPLSNEQLNQAANQLGQAILGRSQAGYGEFFSGEELITGSM